MRSAGHQKTHARMRASCPPSQLQVPRGATVGWSSMRSDRTHAFPEYRPADPGEYDNKNLAGGCRDACRLWSYSTRTAQVPRLQAIFSTLDVSFRNFKSRAANIPERGKTDAEPGGLWDETALSGQSRSQPDRLQSGQA